MTGSPAQLTPAEAAPTVFISNIEGTLSDDGRVNNGLAKKVGEISSRAVWYGEYDTVVLPAAPDPAFVDYAAGLGREPRLVVPRGLRTDNLSMYDGFGDPAFRGAVRGRWSESYIGDSVLHRFVTDNGGRYANGDPGNTIDIVNDKANFTNLSGGTVSSPPGVVATGLRDITDTVHTELLQHGRLYVRHTRSGGGLGNRSFAVNGHVPTKTEIATKLIGDQPKMWEKGTALVEQFVPLVGSPSVAVRAGVGVQYDTYQITNGNDYMGCWSPVPPEVWDPKDLHQVGEGFARRLGELGFWNWAGADLGVGPNGERYGFEINGRTVGTRHSIAIGERLLGPWETWREQGVALKAVDHFVLKGEPSFAQLHETLAKAGLLATPDNPFGAVITIAPVGNIAGIQVHGKGYKKTEQLYQKVVDAVGHPTANQEDHPLLDSPLMTEVGK